jgi:hypothetical protein
MDNNMNNDNIVQQPNNENKNQNVIIGVLIFLLILSFLGINLLTTTGNILESVSNILGPFFNQILALLGYTTGTVINKATDVVTDTAKVGIDITGGAVHNVGDLLIDSTKPDDNQKLDNKINNAPKPPQEPKPDKSENPIQNPVTASKKNWCLVGEYQGRRGCIEIKDQDKCISGQVFPEQKMCLNPTLTPNAKP